MSTLPQHSRLSGTLFTATIEDGPTIGTKIRLASTWGSRLKGLLGTTSLAHGEGLLLVPCSSIHMFFMSISLDVLFLDQDGVVLFVYHSLRPWRISSSFSQALAALELKSGTAKALNIEKGDRILFHETI